MKKIIFILFLSMFFLPRVYAINKEVVDLHSCVDGDTANFIYYSEKRAVRFLAIDTPEKGSEEFGVRASDFTCDKLLDARIIELELDPNSSLEDKYGRLLAWVWVDGKLLQETIVLNGLAPVAYLYGDYKYVDDLKAAEFLAKQNQINIWHSTEEELDFLTIMIMYPFWILITVMIYMYYSRGGTGKAVMKKIVKVKSNFIKAILLLGYTLLIVPTAYDLLSFIKKTYKKRR